MTTFQRVMALYWCLLPFELAYVWLDVSRQRARRGTPRRAVAARRQLWSAPGALATYAVGFVAVLGLVARFGRLEGSQQVLGLVCAGLLLLSAWRDAQCGLDAWGERGSRHVTRATHTPAPGVAGTPIAGDRLRNMPVICTDPPPVPARASDRPA